MSDFLLIIIRSIVAFLLLLFLTRIMGKKQLSQLTFFDYVVGITIGSIAATMSTDKNIQISNGIISLAIWGFFPIVLGIMGMKSRKFLQLTDGRPSILIKNGAVLEESMKKNKIAIDELMMMLREKDVFKLEDIEIAILETNGELSVMKKSDLEPITPKTLGMKVKLEHAPSLLVVDGHILNKNLSILGYSKKWLMKELEKKGAKSLQDVFLAQVDSSGKLFVDVYKDKKVKNHEEQ
ncbi:DUF421 domain-containing protein [Lysinibacillus yapensis]|uniref:DUF421 domain-containing protein n=1 Tax=Ureibacillus yapensis TaxID=2304605 RepID=A0A396SG22_9BACL|nr:DUF421 domain-containing protein [Lysinibacillus yapensis]RHW37416.1 DUF421 domain-containing protein [Lysinibacillus yapensis]